MTHTCPCLIEVGLLSIDPSNSIYSSKLRNNSLKSVLCSFYHQSFSVTAADLWGNAPHSCVAIRKVSFRGIRYESDDVIWLRNHASTWILVPNIGCKQTMASNTGRPLTYFLVFTHFSFWIPQGNTKRRDFVQIKPRYWKKFWGCQ